MSSKFLSTLAAQLNKHQAPLRPRTESDLEFIGTTSHRPAKLLYDTTVYIDILQGRFPRQGAAMLRATEAWHSPVTEAELAATCGLLDPVHSQTREIVRELRRSSTYDSATGRSRPIPRSGGKLECCMACWPGPRDTDKTSGRVF